MFERFTDQARRVLVLAQQEARLLNHDYIGTEHILIGLADETEGTASQLLSTLGVSGRGVRHQVCELVGRGSRVPEAHIPFTPRSRKAVELALQEADRLGDEEIGTEHLLLGIIEEARGPGAKILAQLGAEPSRVRQDVLNALRHGPSDV